MDPVEFRARAKQKLLFRTRMKIVTRLHKAFAIEHPERYTVEEHPDPLVLCCTNELRPTVYGRLGLYFTDVKPPAFSSFLVHPQKSTAKLEEAYQEAEEVYGGISAICPSVVFETNEHFFVYTSLGNVEDESVLLIRNRGRLRFVYGLPNYLVALGATTAPEE